MNRLSILRCVSHLKWGADRRTLLMLYRSIIRSKIDYGSQVYGSAPERILSKLDTVHNAALRLCTGAFRSSPIDSLLVECNEMSLSRRRTKLGMQHYLRLQRLPDSPAYDSVIGDELFTDAIINILPNKCLPLGARTRKEIQELQLPEFNVMPCPIIQEPRYNLADLICKHFSSFLIFIF